MVPYSLMFRKNSSSFQVTPELTLFGHPNSVGIKEASEENFKGKSTTLKKY